MSTADGFEVNSARSSLRRPLSIIKATIRDLPSTFSLSTELALRDLSASFRQSKFGFLWIILQPAMYGLIFVVIKFGMRGVGFEIDTGSVPPALFALVGITLYQAWLDALTKQLGALRASRAMLKTVRMPPEILFFTPMVTASLYLLARLLVIGVAVLILGWTPTWNAAWFPLAALGVVFSGQAIGFLLLPLATLYKDVSQFISSIALGILLLSPVLYPATTRTETLLYKINMVNPLAATLSTARDLLLKGEMVLLHPALIWFAASFVITLVMMVCIRVVLPVLLERVH